MFYRSTQYLVFGLFVLTFLALAIGGPAVMGHPVSMLVIGALGCLLGMNLVIFSGRHSDDHFKWTERTRNRFKGLLGRLLTLFSAAHSPSSYRALVLITGFGFICTSLFMLIVAVARMLRD